MKVPYNYLPLQFKNIETIIEEWRELITSTQFTLGPYMKKFENKFANFIGAKHVIGTNTGTDALILSLKALDIGSGDEVISVTNTFYATIGAIVAVGANPILVDCDQRYQIDFKQIEKSITKRTKAILPVHWGGASPDMYKIIDIAKQNNIYVIEDACMSPGGSIYGKHPGTFGDVSAFSMHPLKPLHVFGDGGMVATNSDKLASWMIKYRNHGMIDRDHIDFYGVNMRLQPLQAIVANHVLDSVNESVAIRNKIASIYDDSFKDIPQIIVPERPNKYVETFSLYMILCEDRNDLLNFLIENGIEAKIHYPIPLHLQKASKRLGYRKGDLPISEYQAKKIITLPNHQYLTSNMIDFTINMIKKFYQKN